MTVTGEAQSGDPRWGFGVEGSLEPAAIVEIGRHADEAGYASFWVNIVPGVSDPAQILIALADVATGIDVGIGVVPVDRYPVADIAERVKPVDLHWEGVVFGIGGGHTKVGMLAQIESAIRTLREIVPTARIGLAGYGPRVLELGGRLADALCLAWMTPDGLQWASAEVSAGSVRAARPAPPIYAYVRCAVGHDAVARIHAEVANNKKYAWYDRHRERMGPGLLGVPLEAAEEIGARLRAYSAHAQPVVRPILRSPKDLGEWHEMVHVLAPPAGDGRQSERR